MQSTVTDIIEEFLLSTMGDEELISICRNDLATHFSCAPSQINYVLTTRFTVDRGFIVESRRGGGGHITIFKSATNPHMELLTEAIAQTQSGLSYQKASHIMDRLIDAAVISKREADIARAAISDKALKVDYSIRNELRASIFERILTQFFKEKSNSD